MLHTLLGSWADEEVWHSPESSHPSHLHGDLTQRLEDVDLLACFGNATQLDDQCVYSLVDGAGVCGQVAGVEHGLGAGSQCSPQRTSARAASARCHVMSCRVVTCHAMPCHVMSCRVVLCRVMSRHVISCHEAAWQASNVTSSTP